MAACDDGKEWSFYLINDSAFALDWAVLHEISYEWGDMGNSEAANERVAALATGAHALVWRDDGSGAELRMDLLVRACVGGHEAELRFEFPKLYLQRGLKEIAGLGKVGYAVAAETILPSAAT
jgi:hypothetical protein